MESFNTFSTHTITLTIPFQQNLFVSSKRMRNLKNNEFVVTQL